MFKHDWRKFESNKFISDFNQIVWEQILCTSKTDSLLEINAPLKKLNKKEPKFLTRSQITLGLQKSINKKNKPKA